MSSFKGFIYCVTNEISKKIYVGQTRKPIKARLQQHIVDATRHDRDTLFCRAIRKYGKENFTVKCLEEVLIPSLNEREIYWINKLNSRDVSIGYNMTPGGNAYPERVSRKAGVDHFLFGKKRSKAVRDKISKARSGKLLGEENPFYKKKHPTKLRKQISQSLSKTLQASGKVLRGEGHHFSKLTWKSVRTIRALHKNKAITYRELAEKFNISPSMVGKIVRKENWIEDRSAAFDEQEREMIYDMHRKGASYNSIAREYKTSPATIKRLCSERYERL